MPPRTPLWQMLPKADLRRWTACGPGGPVLCVACHSRNKRRLEDTLTRLAEAAAVAAAAGQLSGLDTQGGVVGQGWRTGGLVARVRH